MFGLGDIIESLKLFAKGYRAARKRTKQLTGRVRRFVRPSPFGFVELKWCARIESATFWIVRREIEIESFVDGLTQIPIWSRSRSRYEESTSVLPESIGVIGPAPGLDSHWDRRVLRFRRAYDKGERETFTLVSSLRWLDPAPPRLTLECVRPTEKLSFQVVFVSERPSHVNFRSYDSTETVEREYPLSCDPMSGEIFHPVPGEIVVGLTYGIFWEYNATNAHGLLLKPH